MNINKAIILISSILFISPTFANSGASNNISVASKHSALTVSHGALASVKVGSAVAATPLLVVGTIAEGSKKLGENLMEFATDDQAFEVTDKTITAAPSPAQAMNENN